MLDFRRYIVLIILVFSSLTSLSARQNIFRGYTGGMMLHAGYVYSDNFILYNPLSGIEESLRISGVSKGVGGLVKFKLGEHLRVGGEGYVSTVYYGDNGSFMEFGWGGILADYCWNLNKWTPFAGLNFGGGSVKNLIFANSSSGDFIADAMITSRKYPVLSLTPFVGVEYAVTGKISICFKADFNAPLGKREHDVTNGLRFHIGMLFNRISR